MGDKFLDLLLNGMKRLTSAVGNFWKRFTTPPANTDETETYVDQW